MANIASQKKRNARTLREHDENRRLTSAVRTHFSRLRPRSRPATTRPPTPSTATLCSRIDKAVAKGALHRNSGARKKARGGARSRRRR